MSERWEPRGRKSFPFELEEKDGIDSEERIFKGFAAVMGNFDGRDIIEPGAFKKTIKEGGHRVKIYWIHNWQEPIGKALELKEVSRGKLPQTILDRAPDATGGLFVKGYISRIPEGDRALEQMRDGTLNEMSIGFDVVKEEWEENEEGIEVRHLKEIRLYDVSPVPLAMNPAALVTDVKKMEGPEMPAGETKPYPNEHSCRLEDPGKYDTCRRGKRTADKPDSVKGKEYVVIYCKKGDGPMEQQAFRYPKDSWTAAEGRAHCKYNDGQFEAAAEESDALKKAEIEARMQAAEIQGRMIEAEL